MNHTNKKQWRCRIMDFPQVQAIKEQIEQEKAFYDDKVITLDQQIKGLILDREKYLIQCDKYSRQLKLIEQVIDLVNQQLEGTEDLADSLDGDSDLIEIPDTPYLSDCDW